MPNKPANSIGLRDKPMKITHYKLADRMAATTLLNTAEIRTQSCSHWHCPEWSHQSTADPFLQCTNYFMPMKSYASLIRSTCWWQSEAAESCQLATGNWQLATANCQLATAATEDEIKLRFETIFLLLVFVFIVWCQHPQTAACWCCCCRCCCRRWWCWCCGWCPFKTVPFKAGLLLREGTSAGADNRETSALFFLIKAQLHLDKF